MAGLEQYQGGNSPPKVSSRTRVKPFRLLPEHEALREEHDLTVEEVLERLGLTRAEYDVMRAGYRRADLMQRLESRVMGVKRSRPAWRTGNLLHAALHKNVPGAEKHARAWLEDGTLPPSSWEDRARARLERQLYRSGPVEIAPEQCEQRHRAQSYTVSGHQCGRSERRPGATRSTASKRTRSSARSADDPPAAEPSPGALTRVREDLARQFTVAFPATDAALDIEWARWIRPFNVALEPLIIWTWLPEGYRAAILDLHAERIEGERRDRQFAAATPELEAWLGGDQLNAYDLTIWADEARLGVWSEDEVEDFGVYLEVERPDLYERPYLGVEKDTPFLDSIDFGGSDEGDVF